MITNKQLAVRLGQVADALGFPLPDDVVLLADTVAAFTASGVTPSAEATYLLHSVVGGAIPVPADIVRLHRRWRLNGTPAAAAEAITRARSISRWGTPAPVRIVSGIVVDVHDTAHTPFTTGIQRVVRSTVPLWTQRHPLTLVAWDDIFTAPRGLDAAQHKLALGGRGVAFDGQHHGHILIPFRATVVLPEIAVDERRASRLQTIAAYSGSRSVAIGFDCIPVTTAETAGAGMPGGFARYLSTLAAFDTVAPISGASGVEFSGWRGMLGGAGIIGPDVTVVDLPGQSAEHIDAEPSDALRARLGIATDETVLLAVGSHEPRKNHLALLQAAELAWRAGHEFTLVMVGGNSWDTAAFDRALTAATEERSRRIITLSGADDATVWGLYRTARFSLFPSLNEGFGLPIVESIANGTPVITSGFGSMRELAEGFGGVLVDPRDEASIAAAIIELLVDDARLEHLRAETALLPERSWDDYAADLWAAFSIETS